MRGKYIKVENLDADIAEDLILEQSLFLQRACSIEALEWETALQSANDILSVLGYNADNKTPYSLDTISRVLQRLGSRELLPNNADFKEWVGSLISVEKVFDNEKTDEI